MVDYSQLLSTGLAVVSVGTLTGLGLLRGVVTNLREQLRDERDEGVSLRAQRAEDKAQIEQLKTDLSALGRIVVGEAHWQAIGDQLHHHHTEARQHWTEQARLLTEVRDALRGQYRP